MPSICYYGGSQHTHATAGQARACYNAHLNPPTPAMSASVDTEAPTERQVNYIRSLGGDMRAVTVMTKRVASRYIDALKGAAPMAASATHSAAPIGAGGASASVATVTTQPPVVAASRPSTTIPLPLLQAIPAAHYATRLDSNEPYTFMRIRKPKTGRFRGCLVIQTRHGENFVSRFAVWPSGSIWWGSVNRPHFESLVMMIIADYQHASITYAREIGRCMICGKHLTDERSRWYGIGPDCETRHGWAIERSDEEFGPYYPGRERSAS